MVLIIFISLGGLIYEPSNVQLYCVSFAEQIHQIVHGLSKQNFQKMMQFIFFSSESKCALSCDVSFSQKGQAVDRLIRNKTFSITGSSILEIGRERLKPYRVRVKTRSRSMWKKNSTQEQTSCRSPIKPRTNIYQRSF